MSPDTLSLLFPDRPIRPLPKRRLRERLSPEVADSIRYPRSTHEHTPLFFYPQQTPKIDGIIAGTGPPTPTDVARRHVSVASLPQARAGDAKVGGSEIGPGWGSQPGAKDLPVSLNRSLRPPQSLSQSQLTDLQPPPSVTSSADGYESFENTNNKKKRKIPTIGDTVLGGSHTLSHEINLLARSTQTHLQTNESPIGDQSQHGSPRVTNHNSYATNNNQDLSGSGRGRLSRSMTSRSPLRSLPEGNGIWAPRQKGVQPLMPPGQGTSSIISNAIANAGKLSVPGQENVSLMLQRSTTTRPMPASTQFTFTCESQVPGAVQWPGQSLRHNAASQAASGPASAPGHIASAPQGGSSKASSRKSAILHAKTRRRLEKELLGAARNRRQLATNSYFHNPPKLEDVWICEFCEYERIFGEPPRILIRDYEIRDRRHRREEADRKRLLEKAKAKSRKAKKNGKSASRGSQAVMHTPDQLQDDRIDENDAALAETGQIHSTQSEGEYEDIEGFPLSTQEHVNGVGTIHSQDSSLAGAKT